MRSDMIKKGDARAAHRSLLRATGVGEETGTSPSSRSATATSTSFLGTSIFRRSATTSKECVRARPAACRFLFNTIGVRRRHRHQGCRRRA